MEIYAIVLAAGKGTRMKSNKPKVVHEVLYKPMINHVVDVLKSLGVDETYVVVGHKAEQVMDIVDDVVFVHQDEQLGTGHAVLQAYDYLKDKEGITLVVNGDAPLIRKETLQSLIDNHIEKGNQCSVITCDCDLSSSFGRVIKKDDKFVGIIEQKDLSDDQKNITEMNLGEYCFDNQELFKALQKVGNNNAQKEYYITDVVGIMNDEGLKVDTYKIDDVNEVGGINDRVELAQATKILQQRVNREHLLNGVNIIDSDNTYIGRDVEIGEETTIEPGCIIKGKTKIGSHCHIGPYCEFDNVEIKDNVVIKFSVLSDSIVESGTDIGPYSRLRTNCHIRENVHMGNFVEMKNADFGKGSKAAHLTYIGDAKVGEDVNIGCGTITVNYDGKNKSETIIEDDAFIGCNSNLIAPVTVKENAFIAAGSTITDDVEEDAMAIARARQVNKKGYSKVLKDKREKKFKEINK